MVGRTTFIIAHRLSTLRQATNILVLDRGAIVEEGAPLELLDRGGRYAELYRLQSRVAGVEAEATEPLRAVSERS
jgi:ATP-binding cassette subfamily B protein